jgi:hypothetical protein
MSNQSFLLVIFAVCLLACSPPEQAQQPTVPVEPLKSRLANIKRVPSHYTNQHQFAATSEKKPGDSAYQSVLKMSREVLEELIKVLPDTSLTQITNTCGNGNFTYGQLAFLLIDDIEDVPYFTVTNIQFDVFDCGILPAGLLDYLKTNGRTFQKQYSDYIYSKAMKAK